MRDKVFITAKEAAAQLGMDPNVLRTFIRLGKFPEFAKCLQTGRSGRYTYLIHQERLNEYRKK